ncbi:hypothetical protein DFP72DRAFT_936564 [Ephemerocybe angulata]|uniref:DUF6533 domain-containing protein n=1 Tax=Ephemerocybe angulata TaxID=980116 RepID=A0A8H6H919_9AGAR|nr:hypothetical protein DFP72DRAFT_936564 [Tulosesus angulatus]
MGAGAIDLEASLRAIFERNTFSLVALVFVTCELANSLEDEVRYIWRGQLNKVKVIYLLARYFGLAGLISNVLVLLVGPLSSTTTPVAHCRIWFTAMSVVSCSVLFAIDAISMLRVYALYRRSVKIGAFFASVLITEATLVTTCSSQHVGKVPFSPSCDVEKTPHQVIFFTCGVIFAQCSLLLFTFLKRQELVGQRQVPILKLVFREGAWISTLICSMFLFTVPYSLITGTSKPHLVLIMPIAILSPAACRIILNMHRLSTTGRSTARTQTSSLNTDTDIQFTSLLDTSLRPSQLEGSIGNNTFDSRSDWYDDDGTQRGSETSVCTSPDSGRLSALSLPLSSPSHISYPCPPPDILLKPEFPS